MNEIQKLSASYESPPFDLPLQPLRGGGTADATDLRLCVQRKGGLDRMNSCKKGCGRSPHPTTKDLTTSRDKQRVPTRQLPVSSLLSNSRPGSPGWSRLCLLHVSKYFTNSVRTRSDSLYISESSSDKPSLNGLILLGQRGAAVQI